MVLSLSKPLVLAVVAGTLASPALAGLAFEPITSNVSGSVGTQIQVPFQIRLTGGQSSVDISYAAFNFSTTDPAIAQVVGWSWDPLVGGSAGPVTYSHFWSPMLSTSQPTLLMGTLTLQMGNVIGQQATVSITQISGPQGLWTGTCPEDPERNPLTATVVPTPGALAGLMPIGLLALRRRRSSN